MQPIFHITHLRNLERILGEGCLWSNGQLCARDLAPLEIAHLHIKQRREHTPVPVGPGGYLSDYVPFYFAPRSPMLYVIFRGMVEGYDGGQEPVLHLVSSAEAVAARGLPFVFSDGHPTVGITRFFCDLDDLKKIDQEVMHSIYWRDTFEDPDRKRRRQAELLVRHRCPWDLISEVAVRRQSVADQVREILERYRSQTPVSVRPEWYY